MRYKRMYDMLCGGMQRVPNVLQRDVGLRTRYGYTDYCVAGISDYLSSLSTGRYIPSHLTTHIFIGIIPPLPVSLLGMIRPDNLRISIQCHLFRHALPIVSPTPVVVRCRIAIYNHHLSPGFLPTTI